MTFECEDDGTPVCVCDEGETSPQCLGSIFIMSVETILLRIITLHAHAQQGLSNRAWFRVNDLQKKQLASIYMSDHFVP